MRRFAGGWVRQQALSRLHVLMVLGGIAVGFGIHAILLFAASGPDAFNRLRVGAMILAVSFLLLAARSMTSGSIANWLKGAESEERVGQTIEYAITAKDCAVAHSVTDLTNAGDIDHLVATPSALWVVETKTTRVPRRYFPRVMQTLAGKVKAVRRWAPPGTPVRGCLVLANPAGARRTRYQTAGEPLTVHTAGSLAKELASEAASDRIVAPGLTEAVWRLGRIKE